MTPSLRLMCILAHPDDESLGLGGTLAKYSAEGVEIHVLLASRGERGRDRTASQRSSAEELGRAREREARAAGAVLGVCGLRFLGLPDGGLDRVDAEETVGRIVADIRSIGPQVVVTLPPDGGDGHPDHVAVSQLATAAVARACNATDAAVDPPPHAVSKLYYLVLTRAAWDALAPVFNPAPFTVDGIVRTPSPWPDWAVTTVIDATDSWRTAWAAVQCHRTQLAGLGTATGLAEEQHRALWGTQRFYRAFSLISFERGIESDLFAGLR